MPILKPSTDLIKVAFYEAEWATLRMNMSNKIVLITGCSAGIGQATAIHLSRLGYHVFASMRNPEAGSAALTKVASTENLNLETIHLDVTSSESSERAVQKILDTTGRLDVLINNAGISGGGPIEEMPESVLRTTFETNFFGAMRMMRLVLPTMRQAHSGTIVNVSSVMARWITPQSSAYSGSKVALEAASEALAQEVRRFNVRVTLIEPGVIRTPIFEKKAEGIEEDLLSPYGEFIERHARFFGGLLKNASSPELVAQTIQKSLEDDLPRFRYLVGEDAKMLVAGREKLTDEAWIDWGREMTLDDYAALSLDHFGIEI